MLRPPALSLLLLALSFAQIAAAQERFALVIGNGKYRGAGALNNPPNDATAVAAALEKLEFKVTKKIDVELGELEDAVVEFRKSVTKGSVVIFFYAGHGLQVKGENFLVPVDAEVKEEAQVRRKCYPIDEVLTELEESSASLKVVILDCCRDNPLTRSFTRTTSQGLATIARIPDGTIIAFSTAPGKTALDGAPGSRGNSPYTTHLVAALTRRPREGLELTRALKDASKAVKLATGQVPWMNQDATIDDFFLWRETESSIENVPQPMPPKPTEPSEPDAAVPRKLKQIAHPSDPQIPVFENSIRMKFVVIPAGEFQMGSPEDDADADPDEKPQHRVKISRPFHLGLYEVTLGQFLMFYHGAKYKTEGERDGKGGWGVDEATKSVKQGPNFTAWSTGVPLTMDHPVVNVSWNDAQAFCKWLSEKEKRTYRLPTEAEWEYACRAGTKTRFWCGEDLDDSTRAANTSDDGKDGFANSAPVGSFRPNPWGVYDTHGNVLEWCEDWYQRDVYAARSGVTVDPKVLGGEKTFRVMRGGGWSYTYEHDRCANRVKAEPSDRNDVIGFRVVLDLAP